MSTHEHPVRQLLWCALTALRTAQEEHHIHSEARLRRYLREWLQGAAKLLQFRSIPEEIMALKRLLDEDRHVPIISTLNALFMSSVSADNCDLFRFRAALNAISRKGWRCGVCPWPEQVFSETITQACTGRESLLQLTRTEECFSSAGKMTAPVTLQLIFPLDNDNTTAEDLFSNERFQVVHGRENQYGIAGTEILVRTLFLGLPSLPEELWALHQSPLMSDLRMSEEKASVIH